MNNPLLDTRLRVTISVDLPPNGLICVNGNISFTCRYVSTQHLDVTDIQYRWSINGTQLEVPGSMYTMRVLSQLAIKIYCEVIVKLKSGRAIYGNDRITVHDRPNGKAFDVLYAPCDHGIASYDPTQYLC